MALLRRPRRILLVAAAIAVLVLGAAAPAWADEPAPHPQEKETRWYGWQTLVADGGSLALVVSLSSKADGRDGSLALIGVGTYVLAPPIIHLAHGRPGVAAGSLSLRLLLPVGGAFIGSAVASGCTSGDFCTLRGAAFGGVLGIAGAVAIDAALLSHELVDPPTPPAKAPRPYAVSVTPVGGPRKEGGFDVGVAFIF